MQANPFIIAIVLALVAIVVYFIIRQNNKNRRRFEQQQNTDYPKPKDDVPKTYPSQTIPLQVIKKAALRGCLCVGQSSITFSLFFYTTKNCPLLYCTFMLVVPLL